MTKLSILRYQNYFDEYCFRRIHVYEYFRTRSRRDSPNLLQPMNYDQEIQRSIKTFIGLWEIPSSGRLEQKKVPSEMGQYSLLTAQNFLNQYTIK